MKISEKRLIELLKTEYKFEVPEAEGKKYQHYGHIKYKSNSYKSFIKKVESICESVIRLRKGRNDDDVYYEINGLKEQSENYTGGSGGNNSYHDQQMAAHLFNVFTDGVNDNLVYGDAFTYKELARHLKLPLVETKDFNEGVVLLNNYLTQKQSYNVMTNYKNRIQTRSKDTIKSSLNILKKNKHIQVETVYCAIDEDNKEVYFNRLGYLTVKEDLESLFEEYSFSYAKWFYGNSNHLVEKMEIQDRLLNVHGVKNIFKKYLIKLNHTNKLPAESDVYNIYFHKLDKLTVKLHNKNLSKLQNGEKSLSIFDEYHRFLMSILNNYLFKGMSISEIRESYYEDIQVLQNFMDISTKRKNIRAEIAKHKKQIDDVNKGVRFNIYHEQHKIHVENLKKKLSIYE